MSDIKLIGSGKFILFEKTLFDLKYDFSSGSIPIVFFRVLIIFGPNLVIKALCGRLFQIMCASQKGRTLMRNRISGIFDIH